MFTIKNKKINILEIIRYFISGGSTFVIDFSLYYLLINYLNLKPWYANLIATPIVWLYMYLIHKFFTFKSKNKTFIESTKFILLVLFNTLAIPLLLYIQINTLGINYFLAKIIVTGLVILWNYPIYKFWVYK